MVALTDHPEEVFTTTHEAVRGASSALGSDNILRNRTAAEQIADRILAVVAVGVLQPGEKLPTEREFADILGVSRATIRQAVARLAALGVLESRRGRRGGTFVGVFERSVESSQAVLRSLEPVHHELESLFDYRSLVEQLIARTAAARRTKTDMREIRKALSAYGAARGASESRKADRALHGAIAIAARNDHLRQLSDGLVSRVNLGFSTEPYSDVLHDIALTQHTALVQAVCDGDQNSAAEIAGRHFHQTTSDAWRSVLLRANEDSVTAGSRS